MSDEFESKRDEQGHFLELPPSLVPTIFDSERATNAVKKRWEKYREAAADAVTKRLGKAVPDVTTPEAAWGVLNARLASQIMTSEKPRGRDLQALGQNMGAIATVIDRSEMENPPSGTAGSAIGALADLVRELRQAVQLRDSGAGDLIDVTAEDNDTRNE
jgi:hypothetical protein